MRAGKNSKQIIDVEIYARYYLLLEEVHEYYCEYEIGYNKKLISMKAFQFFPIAVEKIIL